MQKQVGPFALALLTFLGTPLQVDAHAFLIHAEPRVGSRVKKPPTEVRVLFSEPVQASLSSIKVFDVSGKQVDKKDTHSDRDNRALLCISLKWVLASGAYRVIWRVTSVDTHVTSGDFRFQVTP